VSGFGSGKEILLVPKLLQLVKFKKIVSCFNAPLLYACALLSAGENSGAF